MDHCATSDLLAMPDFDAPDAWEVEAMNKRYKEGYKVYSGIEISGKEPSGPDFIIAQNENEGITVLKQKDYAKLKGIPFTENGYDINYNIAEQMACIIGRENLLQKHFYNDIDGIRGDLSKYGIDYDDLLNLSKKFQNTNHFSLDYYDRLPKGEKGEEFKTVYQNIMAQGFISRRCQELGIVDYQELNDDQRKIELQRLDEFEQFKICDSSVLEDIRSQLQPKSIVDTEVSHNQRKSILERIRSQFQPKNILQVVKNFFAKKTKRLPERTLRFDEKSNLEVDSTADTLKPWDLGNWGIDVEQFRQESYQITQDTLEIPENSIQNDVQIDQSFQEI